MGRGNVGHTEVEGSPHGGDLNATVLRNTVLREIHARHELETADDAFLQIFRGVLHLVQHAVDAIADSETFLEWLQVDVRRTRAEGFEN